MGLKFAYFYVLYCVNFLYNGINTVTGDNQASVNVVTAGYCSQDYLRKKGVDTSSFRQIMDFDTAKMQFVPAKPKIPGCMRIQAQNVTVKERITQITADFEMRISGDPDPNKPTLKCKQNDRPCGCGSGKHSCSYCDMCKNVQKSVRSGSINVNNRRVTVSDFGKHGNCNCNIVPGLYDIDIEICTPDAQELEEDMPPELQNYLSSGTPFSLFTTMLIYNFRFNVMNEHLGEATVKALEAKKARGLIGCYILGSNIELGSDLPPNNRG